MGKGDKLQEQGGIHLAAGSAQRRLPAVQGVSAVKKTICFVRGSNYEGTSWRPQDFRKVTSEGIKLTIGIEVFLLVVCFYLMKKQIIEIGGNSHEQRHS